MKIGFDLLNILYKIINVVSVTSLIDGRIYRRAKPPNSELQDIVILTLPIQNKKDIQLGTVIINIFCQNLHKGTPNETKLKLITDAIITVLEAYNHSDGSYFDLEIISENTKKDDIQVNMSYTSLRINCYIQEKS